MRHDTNSAAKIEGHLENLLGQLKVLSALKAKIGQEEDEIRNQLAELSSKLASGPAPSASKTNLRTASTVSTGRPVSPDSMGSRILRALAETPQGLPILEIAKKILGSTEPKEVAKIRTVCSQLSQRNQILRISHGVYGPLVRRKAPTASTTNPETAGEPELTRMAKILQAIAATPDANIYQIADAAYGAHGPIEKRRARGLIAQLKRAGRLQKVGSQYTVPAANARTQPSEDTEQQDLDNASTVDVVSV